MARVLYQTPTGKHPLLGYTMSVVDLCMTSEIMRGDSPRSWKKGDFGYTSGPVQMSRSAIAMEFLKTDCDYLLMHDDDLAVSPFGAAGNPIDVFVQHMDAHPDVGLIGAVYLRENPRVPLVNMWHPRWPQAEGDLGEMVQAVCNFPAQPFDCAAIGTGFVMIRRAAMKAICARDGGNAGPPFSFQIAKNRWGQTVETGEDFLFCQNLQRLGWKVQADPRFTTIHIKDSGRLTYDQADWGKVENFEISTDPGTRIVHVGGITCLDVSEIRRRDAADRGALSAIDPPALLPPALYSANGEDACKLSH